MFTGMILVRIDECGDEQEVERFDLHLDLDEDELEIWKSRKIAKQRNYIQKQEGSISKTVETGIV